MVIILMSPTKHCHQYHYFTKQKGDGQSLFLEINPKNGLGLDLFLIAYPRH